MGILNVTPDSFSDGGNFASFDAAVAQAERLIADGADILDVGGESTRPFAAPVSLDEELGRVIPVIEAVRRKHDITISIDTTKAAVARAALRAGASIINDVSALRHDPEMIALARETDVPIIIMHMKGTPADMQIKPQYGDVVTDILDFLQERIDWITANGVERSRLIVDPGIGFGKTIAHNLSILKHLDRLAAFGLPVLLGHSRKRFLGEIAGIPVEAERDAVTGVAAALCLGRMSIVRVHNVATTRQALLIAESLHKAE
jgi:dihydropteroate synthase